MRTASSHIAFVVRFNLDGRALFVPRLRRLRGNCLKIRIAFRGPATRDLHNDRWIIAVVLAMIVTIIDAIVYSRLPVEILFAVLGGLATVFWIKYFKLHKRHELLVAALYTVSSLCFLIAWILHIVG